MTEGEIQRELVKQVLEDRAETLRKHRDGPWGNIYPPQGRGGGEGIFLEEVSPGLGLRSLCRGCYTARAGISGAQRGCSAWLSLRLLGRGCWLAADGISHSWVADP